MDAVFLKLLNMSITASWLILAVVVLRLVLKKAPKWIICLLWVAVAIRLVFPFSFTSSFSALSLAGVDVAPDGQVEYFRYAGGTEKPLVEFDTVTLSPTDETVALAPHTSSAYLPPIIGIWLAGAAVLLLYAAVSYLRLRKKVGASLYLQDKVWICDDIKTPFILGIVNPRIYLPSGMEETTQAHVLAHENAHLKRRDHLWKPLGFALLAVYWFNPLCWLAYILLCRDIELACDERVIRSMEKPDMVAYSEALLSCSVPRRMVMACPLAFGEVGVKERIKTVLNYKKPAFWIIIVAVVACVVVALCFLTNPKDETDLYRIDDGKWEMSTIMDTLNGEASIVACNEAQAMLYPNAEIVSLQCTAKDGKILLADGSKTWEGSYTEMTANSDSAIFNVVFPNLDEENGIATVSDTIYLDGSAVRTLVLSCGRYTIYFYKETDNTDSFAANRLSLGDVLNLSDKGEALTWSDFDAYAYTETGSGLYIRVYEIDERFSLWIGGGPTDEPPMYIRLVSEENQDKYIDIRTEDVEAFIAEHGGAGGLAQIADMANTYMYSVTVYMNPLSSYFPVGTTGYLYKIDDTCSLTIVNEETGEIFASVSNPDAEWSPLTTDEWQALFVMGDAPDISGIHEPRVMKLSDKYYLFDMDGGLWLGEYNGDKNGMWSVYELAPYQPKQSPAAADAAQTTSDS